MNKILAGWLALVLLAVVVGVATHWVLGIAIVVVPVVVVYVRLKLSPTYRAATDITMTKTLAD